MGLKQSLLRIYAKRIYQKIQKDSDNALNIQQQLFQSLIAKGRKTMFGKDRDFEHIKTIKDFQSRIPTADYEELSPYIHRSLSGESDVLWPGVPKYFAKTSGTTSGAKYLPISKEAIGHHVRTATNALFYYGYEYRDFRFLSGKLIFLSGSPEMDGSHAVPTGRLSGIVNHQVPSWLKTNQLPSWETNKIEDWETKLDRIVSETIDQNMTLISGIPPWVQMYYERLLKASGAQTIAELFPNYAMFVFGGVSYKPYQSALNKLVGKAIPSLETFPASEGFMAFQTDQSDPSLQLCLDNGIFYEFIPLDQVGSKTPDRLTLADVQINQDYAMIITTNSGLWAYELGDVIRFTSLQPFKLIVTGRQSHFISAFGEHVIAKEVESAMRMTMNNIDLELVEFTVAPHVTPSDGRKPHHQWLIELEGEPIPGVLDALTYSLDQAMIDQNIYYKDLRDGNILKQLEVKVLPKGSFRRYMQSIGKLGGQNKVPRLTNDRKIADALLKICQ